MAPALVLPELKSPGELFGSYDVDEMVPGAMPVPGMLR